VDGERALEHVRKIIAFGPRHAGTEGAEKTRAYILETLRGYGLEPRRHDFKAYTPHPALKEVMMANLSVDIPGPGERTVLVGGHFDGKLLEGITFEGANDGGSSTALVLELARVLSTAPPPCPVRLVFFDGEEALLEWTDSDSRYGSKHMAGELKVSGEIDRLAAVVIVDMIGDARLKLLRDTKSTPWVMGVLEGNARRLGHGAIFDGRRAYIDDDHTPFLQLGIPAAVLIDLDFGPGWQSNAYWHTEKDSVDKLSPRSIEIVGQVVLASLGELARGAANAGKERSR
jgi:Zn-dependent M28 family amino/carboxypeptidase